MGFIHSAECEIMRNNALINLNMIYAAARKGIKRYFFSSSVCIYRDMQPGEPELKEEEAYPALPDNEYGWEKLHAERVVAFGRKHGIEVRKAIQIRYVEGPVGVQSRNFSNERIYSVGWRSRYSLTDGIARTYPWVQARVEARDARRSSPSASQASRSSAR